MKNLLKNIPKMDKILEHSEIKKLSDEYGKNIIKKISNIVIDAAKKEILENPQNNTEKFSKENIFNEIIEEIKLKTFSYFSPQLKKIINATGIVLHTNFGRAPLSEEILENVKKVSCNYSNLEFNLKTGKRGIRYQNIIKYLTDLTGAEDAMVVNNNAGAVLLSLSALAKNREVIVSRGELIEIGGSFRIPEVMEQSGAFLKEVGATNKTHAKDYINAINENTALILKAHTSNYRIVGFAQSVKIEELVEIGKKHEIPVMFDMGSGSFIDLSEIGLPDEPTVESIVKKGVDIVTFSGDKLLGGPQAGIILGRKKYIEILKKHPLNRALRIGKFTLAALEPLFKNYFNKEKAVENILSLKLIMTDISTLKKRAAKIKNLLDNAGSFQIFLKEDFSYVGGGAFPMNKVPSVVLVIKHKTLSPATIEKILLNIPTPVVGRIKNDLYIIDVRTVFDNQVKELAEIIKKHLSHE
jgi:L-seryl-tRNA(Ser) seleniumtransferase